MSHGGDTRLTSQEVLNESYDWLLSLIGTSLWGFDDTTGAEGARRVAVNSNGNLESDVIHSVLPDGAATSANQTVPLTITFNTGEQFTNGLYIVKNGANCNTKLFYE